MDWERTHVDFLHEIKDWARTVKKVSITYIHFLLLLKEVPKSEA